MCHLQGMYELQVDQLAASAVLRIVEIFMRKKGRSITFNLALIIKGCFFLTEGHSRKVSSAVWVRKILIIIS